MPSWAAQSTNDVRRETALIVLIYILSGDIEHRKFARWTREKRGHLRSVLLITTSRRSYRIKFLLQYRRQNLIITEEGTFEKTFFSKRSAGSHSFFRFQSSSVHVHLCIRVWCQSSISAQQRVSDSAWQECQGQQQRRRRRKEDGPIACVKSLGPRSHLIVRANFSASSAGGSLKTTSNVGTLCW